MECQINDGPLGILREVEMTSHQQETSKRGHDGGPKSEVGPEDPELAAATQIYSLEKKASPCLKGGLSSTLHGCHRGWTGRYHVCVARVTEDRKRKNGGRSNV